MMIGAFGGTVVDLSARSNEFLCFFGHPDGQSLFGLEALFFGVFANVLRDLHRAEMRAAHRAEVGEFCTFGGQGLVVKLLCLFRIEPEVELVFPTEFETGF